MKTFRDPLFVSNGHVEYGEYELAGAEERIYYEVRGSGNRNVLLIMGMWATCRHFEQLATQLAANGCRVLSYDSRGIGRSGSTHGSLEHMDTPSDTSSDRIRLLSDRGGRHAMTERQTTPSLAADAAQLAGHVFGGGGEKVHVFGISLGGMVAQKLAANAATLGFRIASLHLAATTRCPVRIFAPLLPRFLGTLPLSIFQLLVAFFFRNATNKVKLCDKILAQNFAKSFLKSVHPDDPDHRTFEEIYSEKWLADFNGFWTLFDRHAMANQLSAAASHCLTFLEIRSIIDSHIPVTVLVAGKDQVIDTQSQESLAKSLNSRVVRSREGHVMADEHDYSLLLNSLLENISAGDNDFI
ncbi:hypothetical protein HK100_002108 [Physocladia obscura]|uniref:AB hydrolase-1 domain-containing protein n=1 Tax=Physocladia obscura TaxID=109957 RepID=A0AAD5XJK2_9FUNG|nr:hypothetical protein HK100_002108 [Physocladia obscura]